MARSDDPPAAPPAAAAAPSRRRRIGLVAGVAIIAVAIAVAVAFGLSEGDDAGGLVADVAVAQGGESEAPPPAALPDASAGEGFPEIALRAGWAPVGARADRVGGVTVTTVFWGRQGRRIAHTVLPGGSAPPPSGAGRTGRRGVLLHGFEAGPRTAVTWTEDGRTSVISAVVVGRGALYDLAGGPARRP